MWQLYIPCAKTTALCIDTQSHEHDMHFQWGLPEEYQHADRSPAVDLELGHR